MKTKLEIAKQIVKENYHAAECGIFNCRGWMPDNMNTLYDDGELRIDICYCWSYFEVFGLSCNDFAELVKFYDMLPKEEKPMEIKCNYTEKPCSDTMEDCSDCDIYKNAAMKFEPISKLKKYAFSSRVEADRTIDILHDLINESGYATLTDWNDLCGILSTIEDHKYRWTKPNIRTNVFRTNDGYFVEFIDMPEYYDDNTDSENNDPVNHPAHYTAGGIECIDAIAAALTSQNDPMAAWLTGQCLKYLWRWPLKNGVEDLKKTRFYLDRLIEHEENCNA